MNDNDRRPISWCRHCNQRIRWTGSEWGEDLAPAAVFCQPQDDPTASTQRHEPGDREVAMKACREHGHTFTDPRFDAVADITCERCGTRRVITYDADGNERRTYTYPPGYVRDLARAAVVIENEVP